MAGIWHTVSSMGFAAAHRPPFRVFCCLMAAFWSGMILLGAVRLACAAPPRVSRSTISSAAASHAVCHCPMCASMGRGGMKCCCCHAGGKPSASCACTCRSQSQAATVAVLVWSPLAVLPGKQVSVPPSYRACSYPALASCLCTLSHPPAPRPPRFL